MQTIVEFNTAVMREVGLFVVSGGTAVFAGRSLGWILSRMRLPRAAMAAVWRKLEGLAFDGARVVIGGVVFLYQAGKWIAVQAAKLVVVGYKKTGAFTLSLLTRHVPENIRRLGGNAVGGFVGFAEEANEEGGWDPVGGLLLANPRTALPYLRGRLAGWCFSQSEDYR